MDLSKLPALNASLNAMSFLLISLGYFFIQQRALTAHIMCMLAACGTSTLFLISYLFYHFHHGSTKFQGEGPIRIVYFAILISHTILAMAILPMVIKTLVHGFQGKFGKHVAIARWTLPIWMYVSITGVAIYWMLYRM